MPTTVARRLNRNLLFLALACSLAACKPSTDTATAPAPTEAAATAPAIGVDLAGIDKSVKPGDDFDAFANGTWRNSATIPDDRSSIGTGYEVQKKAEQRNADLIKGLAASNPAAGSDARKIADYYAAYMDEAGIEARGLQPLQPELAKIDAIASKADLARVLGSGLRADVDPLNATNYHTDNLFGLFVAQGLQDPEHNVATLMQGGVVMPDREYYLSNDKEMMETRAKYLEYVTALLRLANVAEAEGKAKDIVALETKIAKAQSSIVDTQDVHKANNPWAMADFAKKAPGLDWNAYFAAAGLSDEKTIVAWQPLAITRLSALVGSEPLEVWKDYLTFHALSRNADLLPKAYADLRFGFFGTTLQGTPKQKDRWKRALDSTNNALGDAVGKLYVEKYFPASSKAQVEEMVRNILAAFAERVDTLEWMTPQTKAKAKAKAQTMRVSVGYPETWRDYGALEIRADDPLGNRLRAEEHEYKHQIAKLHQSVDRGEWWMTPQTVNAVNLPLQNAMNFPAAILEAPFFDPRADAAANYGSIGAVIGHEISHGFDDTGAEFDAQGRLANWWTPEDAKHFKEATARLAAQYDAYEPLPGLHIKGEQTLGENIADVSGLTIAYLAYKKSLGGKEAPVIDGLTGDQRFFLAYAQGWRSKMRDAALRQRVLTDGHSPGRWRAQTVRNIDAWYDAYGAKPGEQLYLAPADRVKIW
ncbi:M13 family metallopeptidase [Lysobacter yangpyeongensis]|uniref:M13 family metallopeptidase n=1 Tax=Lysobacter yangpyeongensis TaxID=346182 RepID=A0ABW0SP90_9GAMM